MWVDKNWLWESIFQRTNHKVTHVLLRPIYHALIQLSTYASTGNVSLTRYAIKKYPDLKQKCCIGVYSNNNTVWADVSAPQQNHHFKTLLLLNLAFVSIVAPHYRCLQVGVLYWAIMWMAATLKKCMPLKITSQATFSGWNQFRSLVVRRQLCMWPNPSNNPEIQTKFWQQRNCLEEWIDYILHSRFNKARHHFTSFHFNRNLNVVMVPICFDESGPVFRLVGIIWFQIEGILAITRPC